jgi:hypothetical protein
METASRRVAVIPYKNQRGPGWVVAHELDDADNILCVFVRVEAGGQLVRFHSDRSGQPTTPFPE